MSDGLLCVHEDKHMLIWMILVIMCHMFWLFPIHRGCFLILSFVACIVHCEYRQAEEKEERD